MSVSAIRDRTAVLRAIGEYDDLGRERFLLKYEFGAAAKFYVAYSGRLYDAKAILGAAHGYAFPDLGPAQAQTFSGGDAAANKVLRRLGFQIIETVPATIEGERDWRVAAYTHLRTVHGDGLIEPSALRSLGIYGGAQGVWVDAKRTRSLDARGITVGVLHTGLHYADDMSERSITYHYPRTERPAGRDRAEIEATKAAGELRIPLFVISHPSPHATRRQVRMGWVEGWDDAAGQFLITFTAETPAEIIDIDKSDERDFALTGNTGRRELRSVRTRPDQARFKFLVLQRYGARCPFSGVSVPEMLDAAHFVPHSQNGSDDPRNGLPLNAALHRAFDAYLFAIDPNTLSVVTSGSGPTVQELGITTPSLRSLRRVPHLEALQWRYREWARRRGNHRAAP